MTEPHREPFSGSYLDPSAHKAMLQDVVRTTAYDEALRRVVRPGSHVVDFGTGTGVLSIFSARHGAGKIDAIERTAFVEQARRIARRSGHPEIRFHHADHLSFTTDGLADVLVSEWMGHCLFFEAMLEPLLAVRDRWLAPEGVMVPARVSVHAALVTDERVHEDLTFLRNRPYGLDFGEAAEVPLHQVHLCTLEPEQLSSTIVELASLDMKTLARSPRRLVGSARVPQLTLAYGVLAWFSMELTPGFVVGTGPFDPETHWQQVLFPFAEPIEVSPEREFTLAIWPPEEPEAAEPTWRWSFADGETTTYSDSASALPPERRPAPQAR